MSRNGDVKTWRCEQRHALGVVVRDGGGVRRLLLYRVALDGNPGDEDVDVIAVIEGYVADVRCSICGGLRTWVPGQEALRRMLERAR